ncbi:MAG: peptide-methionine (S)-S-oxide reductase MsrA [Firmicutes bacterium]|nr:peptide-methionine (S)-S-oxide reductase MsrA [Bacillota bacterium]
MAVIYFAGGCFWGTEHFFKQVKGVFNTEVGYANGFTDSPSYNEVCSGKTGFAETVKVEYNEKTAPLWFLLDLFYMTIDPTSLNRQGNDVGEQYRTGIYYENECDGKIVEDSMKKLRERVSGNVVIEVMKLKNFYKAETEHQGYLSKNKFGYCHIDRSLFELAKNASPNKKENFSYTGKLLSPIQYNVTQYSATERPYDNEYWNCFDDGIYVDIVSGEPLFSSKDKFFSDCGWPSFSKAIDGGIFEKADTSFGMERREIKCVKSGSHIGHVFDDGPEESGGLRYCVNSAAVDFIPKSKMEEKGYGKFNSGL